MNTYSQLDTYLMNNYGIPGLSLDMLKMAPVLPKTPEEAILLSNLYQVQSTVAKLAAQQEMAMRSNLGYPTYINTLPTPTLPSSLPASPGMSPTRTDSAGSASPQPHDAFTAPLLHNHHVTTSPVPSLSSFHPYDKSTVNTNSTHNTRINPYRRKRRSGEKIENPNLNKRAKTVSKTTSATANTTSTNSKKTFLDLYEAYGVIGVGGGGMVYAGRRITDKLPVAIKRVMREKVKRWEKVQGHNVPQEIALMLR